jgi:hypothetical protein
MFDTLTNAIHAQVDTGAFESVASVHYAEATMLNGTGGDSSYDTHGSGSAPPMGAIGGAVGAAALIGLAIAGYVYMKKRDDDGCGPAAVVPTDRGQAQIMQVLSGDVEVVDAGTGVRGHVFG